MSNPASEPKIDRTYLSFQRSRSPRMALFRFLSAGTVIALKLALMCAMIDDRTAFLAYSVLLLVYIAVEIASLHTNHIPYLWLCPVVLASIVIFVLGYGITNFVILLPASILPFAGLSADVGPSVNRLMLLVDLGCMAMWMGFHSRVADRAGQWLRLTPVLRRNLRLSYRMNPITVGICFAISLAGRLFAMHLGVYGYFSANAGSVDQLLSLASYTMYFHLADQLGSLVLVVLALNCFAQNSPPLKDKLLLGLMLAFEISFGFLSGFKGSVIMPILVVSLVHYAIRGKFPKIAIPAVFVALLFAYAIIEPARQLHNTGLNQSRDIGSVIALGISAIETPSGIQSAGLPVQLILLETLARMNVTFAGVPGIEYAAQHNPLPPGSPTFLRNILTAPISAIVPRFLWSGKAIGDTGYWYQREVLQTSFLSSAAIGLVTDLNFAGGGAAVLLGFFVMGFIQGMVYSGFARRGGGGFIVLFGLLGSLIGMTDSFSSLLIDITRLSVLLLVAQMFLFKPLFGREGEGSVITRFLESR